MAATKKKPAPPLTQHEQVAAFAKGLAAAYQPADTYTPRPWDYDEVHWQLWDELRAAFKQRNNAPLRLPEHLREADDVYARRGVDFLLPHGVWFYGWGEVDISYGKFSELHLLYKWLCWVRAHPLPYDEKQASLNLYSDEYLKLYFVNPY